MSDEQVHETIFLQPWCDGCEKHCNSGEGRMWCQDDVWGKCEECDRKPDKYVRVVVGHTQLPTSALSEDGK